MSEIRNKRMFFELWEAGVLGNRTRLWRSPLAAWYWGRDINLTSETMHSDFPEIGFRELRKPGSAGAGKWEKVPWHRVLETAKRWQSEGREFIMDDGAPDEYQTLQGELLRNERGLIGFLIEGCKLPMRRALAGAKEYSYLQTKMLLQKYMDPSSREDLEALLENYPDHVIEFCCFSINVGIFPGRNTIFWETRKF